MTRDEANKSKELQPSGADADLAALSSRELLGRIGSELKDLVQVEVKLAQAEVKADLQAELATATGLGLGALLGYAGVVLLLVTAVLGLGTVMPGWLAGLLVAGVTLGAAAIVGGLGWKRRVKSPLGRTRRQINETLEWAKGRAP